MKIIVYQDLESIKIFGTQNLSGKFVPGVNDPIGKKSGGREKYLFVTSAACRSCSGIYCPYP